MLDVLKHRREKDNNDCSCGRREPGGLQFHPTGWYCYQCLYRLQTTENKLLGYEDPGPSKQAVISTLLPGYDFSKSTYPTASTPVWTAQPQQKRRR